VPPSGSVIVGNNVGQVARDARLNYQLRASKISRLARYTMGLQAVHARIH
jgi:hypothetical protein